MGKLIIPHIHKIEGDAGFWSEISKKGEVKEIKLRTLEGLRQIEGILIGRRFSDVPTIASRICGICPVVHILNACRAIEKALEIKVSPSTILLRKLLLISQIIQSHTTHLFFLSFADFFNLENDLDLTKKFPKETEDATRVRDFALKITKIVGGREIHPMTPRIGGFSRIPEKDDIKKFLDNYQPVLTSAIALCSLFRDLNYPEFKKETPLLSLIAREEYPFYSKDELLINDKIISVDDFYSSGIKEDLKRPPVKRTKYQNKPYMLGAIARIHNNGAFLNPGAKKIFSEFIKGRTEVFSNNFYNLFYQAVEVVHFLEETEKIIKELLETELIEGIGEVKIKEGIGLSAMEAPRGTLFTYFKIDGDGRVLDCNIITPTAQFLDNLEADLKEYLPRILKFSSEEKIKKIRALIRVYDPCVSCAIH